MRRRFSSLSLMDCPEASSILPSDDLGHPLLLLHRRSLQASSFLLIPFLTDPTLVLLFFCDIWHRLWLKKTLHLPGGPSQVGDPGLVSTPLFSEYWGISLSSAQT